jgi:CrcB protein
MKTLWVGLGGALGSIARYHVGALTTRRWPGFPWGTLAVNVVGSLALAIVMALALRGRLDDTARVALAAGVLGGFTTYSTFNYETIALAQAGAWGKAAIYVAATVLGCLAAGAAGWLLARAA